MPATSTTLLSQIQAGDPESWNEFIEQYEPLIQRVIRLRGVSEHDLGDVAQEVLIRLMRELPKFEYNQSQGRFRNWLRRVTINTVHDWYRRKKRRELRFQDVSSVPDRSETGPVSLTECRYESIRIAMQEIQQTSRTETWACFEQHVLDEKPANVVADALGLSVNAVYINSSRTTSRIREKCHEHAQLEDGTD